MANLKKPLNRTVRRKVDTPYGPLVAILTDNGITLRPANHRKGVSLSYAQVAAYGLSQLLHVRWPANLQGNPLKQMQHLSRRGKS
jgi:hypothetical protein